MSDVYTNEMNRNNAESEQHEETSKRRGRPKGSKNRPKYGFIPTYGEAEAPRQEGWEITKRMGRPKSIAAHRKWQRDWVLPQFVLSRKQAQDLLHKFLRSKPGKAALAAVINDGFVGIKKLPDVKLGEFLVSTNLLSRYPHQIVIRGN
jgi:hypothetical protein